MPPDLCELPLVAHLPCLPANDSRPVLVMVCEMRSRPALDFSAHVPTRIVPRASALPVPFPFAPHLLGTSWHQVPNQRLRNCVDSGLRVGADRGLEWGQRQTPAPPLSVTAFSPLLSI